MHAAAGMATQFVIFIRNFNCSGRRFFNQKRVRLITRGKEQMELQSAW